MRAKNIVPEAYLVAESAIRAAWDETTSADEGWTAEVPELGQCAVTALIVQDLFGGELQRTVANGVSHYYNSIAGVDVDLTRAQFEEPLLMEEPLVRERAYVLSFPATAARYDRLLDRLVDQQLR